jgi:apolipoprotein N-acyltransferase
LVLKYPLMRSSVAIVALAWLASGSLLAAYGQGVDWLGFVALVPWLWALERASSVRMALLLCAGLSVVYSLAVFSWFAFAIANFIGLNAAATLFLLALLGPILQPQFWLYGLARWWTRARSPWLSLAIATATWTASEYLLPKILGDSFGHGLAPSLWFRQGADLAGVAGLTAVLLLVNHAIALALQHWRRARVVAKALSTAVLLPVLLAAYGAWRLASLEAHWQAPAPSVRVGMVQTSLVDYEQRRQSQGAYAVIREILDAHYELSKAAIEHHGAEALLWSETVYPTPYGFPKSAEGAAFDHELKSFVDALSVPLIFGSYDVDDHGEYNAAVLLDARRGLTARYRKTRLFPLTERVPSWLDFAWLRQLLPWTGAWQVGDGARVLPLSTADGRTLNVVPLICLDDVDPMLAIEGARLGAEAIVGLSNDSWFSAHTQGTRLHLAVASFRSIETRMPQLRVTTNGFTAFIDPTGAVLASTKIGDRAVLAGAVPIRAPPTTLMTRWGDWLGPSALAFLALVLVVSWLSRRHFAALNVDSLEVLSAQVSWLPTAAYRALRTSDWVILLALAYIAFDFVLRGPRIQLVHLQIYLGGVILPFLLSATLSRWYRAQLTRTGSELRCTRRQAQHSISISAWQSIRPWLAAWLRRGITLTPVQGKPLKLELKDSKACQFFAPLQGASNALTLPSERLSREFERARSQSFWLDRPWLKFGLFPLLLAIPAFRLHQVISFGGGLGEYLSYGLGAYLQGFLIWWCSWSLALVLLAVALRLLLEALLASMAGWRSALHASDRGIAESLARMIYYGGVPAWFLARVL